MIEVYDIKDMVCSVADKQAVDAYNTLIKYCEQVEDCTNCILLSVCPAGFEGTAPKDWSKYENII